MGRARPIVASCMRGNTVAYPVSPLSLLVSRAPPLVGFLQIIECRPETVPLLTGPGKPGATSTGSVPAKPYEADGQTSDGRLTYTLVDGRLRCDTERLRSYAIHFSPYR
jgi:hypothetical protein